MKRINFKQQAIYHISGKCTDTRWPDMPMRDIWMFFSMHINTLKMCHHVTPLAFVLMHNHFHFLCQDDDGEDFHEVVEELKGCCEGTMTLVNHLDELFEDDKLFCKKIESYKELLDCYKYIYRNPVEAGLVEKVQDYVFSSLHAQFSNRNDAGCVDPFYIIYDAPRVINWLNNKTPTLYFS